MVDVRPKSLGRGLGVEEFQLGMSFDVCGEVFREAWLSEGLRLVI